MNLSFTNPVANKRKESDVNKNALEIHENQGRFFLKINVYLFFVVNIKVKN